MIRQMAWRGTSAADAADHAAAAADSVPSVSQRSAAAMSAGAEA
jgi:hypothetical protein